tara:strand:+ start:733 stop:1662 length:930 start_codon:yes stop_codon:yes gene_type:complete
MNKKGCIFLISARKNLIKDCLKYLDQNYNNKFNYPILIFYHGNIYDNENFRKSIRSINLKTEYRFHKINSRLPSNIKEKDLFWNLDNSYAKSFKGRIGYLHAITFKINFINYVQFNEFDYLMVIDDDSWFKGKIEIDLFEQLDRKKGLFATAYTWKNNQRALYSQHNLSNWIRKYIKSNDLKVQDKKFREALKTETNNDFLNSLNWSSGNCNIYKKEMFKSSNWGNYNKEFNKIAGGYRYRWGDCEIISLFAYIHLKPALIDFDLRSKNLYSPQLPKTEMVISKKILLIENIKNKIKYFLKKILFKKFK